MAACKQADLSPQTLGEALRCRSEGHWERLWLQPAHEFACIDDSAVAATVCLGRLDAALAQVDFLPLLPAAVRRAVRKRQVSYLGGRLCAERCLGRLGFPVAVLERGAQGEPLWPELFRGSITHSDTHASAVAAHAQRHCGIGIDSEEVAGSGDEIIELCCTTYERSAWLSRMQTRCLVATLLFSVKESFYKAIHPIVNRFVDFDEVEVASWDALRSQVNFRPTSDSDISPFAEGARAIYRVGAGPIPSVHTAVLIPQNSPGPST